VHVGREARERAAETGARLERLVVREVGEHPLCRECTMRVRRVQAEKPPVSTAPHLVSPHPTASSHSAPHPTTSSYSGPRQTESSGSRRLWEPLGGVRRGQPRKLSILH
jgi:hypothetical protein